jgi:hypothetical protein
MPTVCFRILPLAGGREGEAAELEGAEEDEEAAEEDEEAAEEDEEEEAGRGAYMNTKGSITAIQSTMEAVIKP